MARGLVDSLALRSVGRKLSDADAEAHGDRFGGLRCESFPAHEPKQLFESRLRRRFGRAMKPNDEFIASQTSDDILRPEKFG